MPSSTVAGVAVETDHWIAGGPRAFGGERLEVRSPIDGAHLAEVPAGDATAVDAAVGAAREAFPGWAKMGPTGRGALLDRFAHALLDRKEAFAQVETADNGSLLAGNLHRVVDRAAHNIAFFSGLARTLGTETHRGPVVDNEVHHDPAGVAALVTPWNAPLLLSTWKLGPALAAGNTVVLKAPEWAPLTCSLLAQTATEVGIPPGVLNVVHGTGAAAGQALVDHPRVDRISFTGSTATGRTVARAAAAHVVPVSLELGGKSPFVVLADADLDEAARTLTAQFHNAGQVCLAGTRVLVDASIEANLRGRVLAASKACVVGDPRQRGVRVGPLINERQLQRVDGFVRRAIEAGARVLLGGPEKRPGGLYYPPTILAGVAPQAPRSSGPRSSDRCSPGRPSRRRDRPSRWPTRPSTVSRPSCSRVTASAPRAWPVRWWPGRCGSTATSCATSRLPSAARAARGSDARADAGASTSSAT